MMRATLLKDTLTELFKAKRPICIEGMPGGGKTTIVQQTASSLKVGYIEKHTPTMLVEDFGVPNMAVDGDSFNYKLPDWYPAESRTDIPDEGVLCFDDRNQAPADIQKVLANILQARTLHGVPLKKGWHVISTGNRQSDRAGANRILSHLRNRETVIELETHLDDWTSWAIEHDVKPELISFIRFRPNLLHDFDPQRDVNATPRSWVEGVSDVIGIVPSEAEYECFKGAVGEGAAAEFVGFLKIHRKLPNPDSILMNPSQANVPDDPATLYALCGTLAHKATLSNFDRVITYVGRMPKEFSVLCISYATRKNDELASSGAFTKWAVDNQDVLF
jgi:hypothetical protein